MMQFRQKFEEYGDAGARGDPIAAPKNSSLPRAQERHWS